MARECGTIIFIDGRCNAHAAATLFISFFQADGSIIPQPDQLFASVGAAIRLTNQRNGFIQFDLYNTVSVASWDRLDLDALRKEKERKVTLKWVNEWNPEILEETNLACYWKNISKRGSWVTRRAYQMPGLHSRGPSGGEVLRTLTSFCSSQINLEASERSVMLNGLNIYHTFLP